MRFVRKAASGAAKVTKYVTMTMPLSMFGWQLNKGLFAWNRSMWTRTVNPTCPDCDAGVLLAQHDAPAILEQTEGGDARPLQAWSCNHCGFGMLAPEGREGIRDAANRHRLARARMVFGDLSRAEREAFGRQHRISSRIFFWRSGGDRHSRHLPAGLGSAAHHRPQLAFFRVHVLGAGHEEVVSVMASHDRAHLRGRRCKALVDHSKVACVRGGSPCCCSSSTTP